MNKNTNYNTLIEYYLPFFLLLSQYKIGLATIGEMGLILLALIHIVKNNFQLAFKKNIWAICLLGYVIFRSLINCIFHIEELNFTFNSCLQWLVMFISVLCLTNKVFDEEKLYKIWKKAGAFFSLGLFYQLISIYVLGTYVGPISLIPGYVLRANEVSLRPSSFFAEPASFTCAMLPLVFMALKKKDYKWALGATLMVIATTSTVAIILTSVLWLLAFLQKGEGLKNRLIFIIAIIVGILVIGNLSIFASSIGKLTTVLEGGSTVGSRIICGFDTIMTMNILEWIFGTTFNDVTAYILQNIYLFSASSPVLLYMSAHGQIFLNTFCLIVFKYGLLGLLLYWNTIYSRLFKTNYEAKAYLIMMLVSIFGQSKFFNAIFFMELMLILLYDRKDVRE